MYYKVYRLILQVVRGVAEGTGNLKPGEQVAQRNRHCSLPGEKPTPLLQELSNTRPCPPWGCDPPRLGVLLLALDTRAHRSGSC